MCRSFHFKFSTPLRDNAPDTNNVWLADDKVVVQNEGRSNVVIATQPYSQGTYSPQYAVVRSVEEEPQTTVVAGEQDVKTNPQSEVGGINEVNQLFPDDDIGSGAEAPEEGSNLLVRFVMFGVPLGALLLIVYLLLHKKQKQDEDSPNT